MFTALMESGSGVTGILDNTVVDFVVNGMKDVIGICTVQPLGTFITIGLVGGIVGLGLKILTRVKRG